jgi:hypothetical protein
MPRYLPFVEEGYSTAPGLTAMGKAAAEDQFAFQIDEHYGDFIDNKRRCRQEQLNKYYLEQRSFPTTIAAVNRLLVDRLCAEHPTHFEPRGPYGLYNKTTGELLQWAEDWIASGNPNYTSLFDALCSQVPEDIAVCQLEGTADWLAAIHLCAPNHWSPADKIGKPFGEVHGPVPGMERLNQHYFRMLATDARLNHHPQPPPGVDAVQWHGRHIGDGGEPIYVRVERQTITGLPECNAFVFTIRTYFYAVDELTRGEKDALLAAIRSMSPQSLAYKGLTGTLETLEKLLIAGGSC